MKTELNKPALSRPGGLHGWLEDRVEIDALWRILFQRKIPYGVNWFYTLGFASVTLFLVQLVTGSVLALYYSPSPDHAYESVQFVMTELPYGQVIRGIHHWGASAMVAMVILHLLAVFVMGAYKYPREATWLIGILLLAVTLGFGFTGYLLPWDEKAYWATTVGTNIAGTVPVVGGFLVRVLRGGTELGVLTLTRFYASHVMLLPMAMMGLVALHLFLVIRQGVSVPPGLWDRANGSLAGLAGGFKAAASKGLSREEYYERYKSFKERGHPFFPDIIFEDAVVSVLAVLIVIVLAVTSGAPLENRADPTNTAYIPRPEWYFMFLFELLKYFPGELEWFGAVVLPGVFILALVLLPFFKGRDLRSPRTRPIGIAVASLSVIAISLLTVRAFQATPPSSGEERGVRLSAVELAGRTLVQTQNCTACHSINGQGSQAGPSLDGIGSRRDPAFIHTYIENPKSVNPGATMPAFIPPLSHQEVEDISRYLLTLK